MTFVYQEFNISVLYQCTVGQCNLSYKDEPDSMVIKNRINAKGESRLHSEWLIILDKEIAQLVAESRVFKKMEVPETNTNK